MGEAWLSLPRLPKTARRRLELWRRDQAAEEIALALRERNRGGFRCAATIMLRHPLCLPAFLRLLLRVLRGKFERAFDRGLG